VWMNGTCASQDKALALHVAAGATASVTIELPIPKDGRWLVTPRVIRTGGPGRATLRLEPRGRLPYPDDEKLVWSWVDEEASGTKVPRETCQDLVPRETPLVGNGLGAGARWVLTATGGTVTLDRTTIKLLH
jgi:hypothetical protein